MIRITEGYENETRNTAITRLPDGEESTLTIEELMEEIA